MVVGAGVIGAAVADALARRGLDVVVLEMRAPGRGASQASAGILAPFTEAQPGSPLLALGRRSLEMYDEFVTSAAERAGRPIEYARTGTLEIAEDDARAAHLRQAHDWLTAEGVASEWLAPTDVTRWEPSVTRSAVGALYIGRHGFVGVSDLVRALLQCARFSGAVLTAPVEVASLEPSGAAVRVRAGEREWLADVAVIAAGSWTNRVRVRGAQLPDVRPIRGQLLHLDVGHADVPSRVVWGADCYAVPWSDGSLLVGATVEDVGFDERTTVDGVGKLLGAVQRLLPATSRANIVDVRAGLRPFSADGLPIVGPIPGIPNVVLATGHYRNGVLLAPLTAMEVVEEVMKEVNEGREGD